MSYNYGRGYVPSYKAKAFDVARDFAIVMAGEANPATTAADGDKAVHMDTLPVKRLLIPKHSLKECGLPQNVVVPARRR